MAQLTQQIGTVQARGNSYQFPLSITFTDNNPVWINYYRLKMVDKDGRFDFSNIVVIRVNGNMQVSTWPNLFLPISSILPMQSGYKTTLTVRITELQGKLVRTCFMKYRKAATSLRSVIFSLYRKEFISSRWVTETGRFMPCSHSWKISVDDLMFSSWFFTEPAAFFMAGMLWKYEPYALYFVRIFTARSIRWRKKGKLTVPQNGWFYRKYMVREHNQKCWY